MHNNNINNLKKRDTELDDFNKENIAEEFE